MEAVTQTSIAQDKASSGQATPSQVILRLETGRGSEARVHELGSLVEPKQTGHLASSTMKSLGLHSI